MVMIAIIVIIVKYNSNNSDSSNSKTSSVLCQDKVDPYKPSATLKPSACLHCLGPNQGSPRIFLETPALQPFLQIHRNPATKRQSQQQQHHHHHHQLLLLQQQQQKLKNAEKKRFPKSAFGPKALYDVAHHLLSEVFGHRWLRTALWPHTHQAAKFMGILTG